MDPFSALCYQHEAAVAAVWEAGACANVVASVDAPAVDDDVDAAAAAAAAAAVAAAAAAVGAAVDLPEINRA